MFTSWFQSRAPAHTDGCPGDGAGGEAVPEVLLVRAREVHGGLQGGAQGEIGGKRAGRARRPRADGPGSTGEAAATAEDPEQAEDGAARQARREPVAQVVDEAMAGVWDPKVVILINAVSLGTSRLLLQRMRPLVLGIHLASPWVIRNSYANRFPTSTRVKKKIQQVMLLLC